LSDLERGDGRLSISMTDNEAFELGRNIAATPGKVVFQNELMQLIQYTPTTPTVRRRPLLIVPPWINKFYVLDLQPKNSFIKWAVDQGHTVFVISWINPDERLAQKNFEDYMLEGRIAAPGFPSISERSGRRPLCCPLARIISRLGDPPTRRRICTPAWSNSCSQHSAKWPAS
jgi:poly(3-hydroxyalkanoate) synthetase